MHNKYYELKVFAWDIVSNSTIIRFVDTCILNFSDQRTIARKYNVALSGFIFLQNVRDLEDSKSLGEIFFMNG